LSRTFFNEAVEDRTQDEPVLHVFEFWIQEL
jgi:hypothetical protein